MPPGNRTRSCELSGPSLLLCPSEIKPFGVGQGPEQIWLAHWRTPDCVAGKTRIQLRGTEGQRRYVPLGLRKLQSCRVDQALLPALRCDTTPMHVVEPAVAARPGTASQPGTDVIEQTPQTGSNFGAIPVRWRSPATRRTGVPVCGTMPGPPPDRPRQSPATGVR